MKIDHNVENILIRRSNDDLNCTCLNNHRGDNNIYFKTIGLIRNEETRKINDHPNMKTLLIDPEVEGEEEQQRERKVEDEGEN